MIGQSPAEHMNDDSLGAGLQMALFDVVGKILEVPVYRLLSNPCRDAVPISWWCIDAFPRKLGSGSRGRREERLYQFQKQTAPVVGYLRTGGCRRSGRAIRFSNWTSIPTAPSAMQKPPSQS